MMRRVLGVTARVQVRNGKIVTLLKLGCGHHGIYPGAPLPDRVDCLPCSLDEVALTCETCRVQYIQGHSLPQVKAAHDVPCHGIFCPSSACLGTHEGLDTE